MQLELYQAETAAHAARQDQILQEARQRLAMAGYLTALEFSGAVHALQVLTENAIGKAKHQLKALQIPVPVSAYDAFSLLHQHQLIDQSGLQAWQRAIGLRNRIVHDYLNLRDDIVYALIKTDAYRFMVDFLYQTLETKSESNDK